MSEAPGRQKQHIYWMDSVKLVACISVFSGHFYNTFSRQCAVNTGFSWKLSYIMNNVLSLFFFGTFWVSVFCIISGFFAWKKKVKDLSSLIRAIVARYLRLVLPLLGINLFVLLISKTVGMHSQEFAQHYQNEWLTPFYTKELNLKIAVRSAFLMTNECNGPYWMLRSLFKGTCGIYVLDYVRDKLKGVNEGKGWCASHADYLMLITAFAAVAYGFISTNDNTYYTGICFAGILFSEINENRKINQFLERIPRFVYTLAIISLFYMVAVGRHRLLLKLHAGRIAKMFFGTVRFNGIGSMILLVSIFHLPQLIKLFEAEVMKQFGSYSFPIYLIHWPVICSGAILLFEGPFAGMNGTVRFMLVYVITAALILALCTIYLTTLERWAVFIMAKILSFYDRWFGVR